MATKVNESRHLEKRVSKEAIEESGRIEAEIESIKRSLLKLRARECPDWRLGSREGDFSRDSTGSHRCDASSGRLYSKLDEEIKRLTLTDSRFEVLYANSKPISRIPHEETPRQQHISLSLSNDSSTIATSSIKSISKQQSLFRPKPVLLSLPSIVPRGNLFNTLNPGHPSPVNPKIRLVSNLKPHIRSTSLHKKTVTFRKAPALPRVATLQDPGLLFQMDSLATESKNEELLARVLRELNEEESLQVGLARKLLSCEAEINENRSHSKACDMLLETTIAKYSESSHYSNAQGRKSSTGNLGKKTSSKKLKQVQLEQNKYLRAEADRKIKQIKETKQAAERQIEVGVYLKDSLKKDLELSRFKATLLAKRLDEVQKTLVKYYLEILREGKDTRTEGLPWLVKAIWRLKSSVLISSMPSFLDTRLIYYIFAFSHRSVELDKAKALLNEARSRVKTYRGRKIRGKSKKIRFDKSEAMKIQNNELRFKVFQPQENKPKSGYDGYLADLELECLNMKEIEGLVDTMGLDADTEFLLAKVLEVEALVRSIEQEMEALRQRELGRICKEFSANSYGERFGVGIETVVSVVVGKENLPGAMKLVGEKLRRYEEGIRRCRNYDSFARKVNAG